MEENKPLTKAEVKEIQKIVEKLFTDLEVGGSFDLSEKEEGIEVVVDSDDNAMLIGYHGEILESLQLILSLVIAKKMDRFVRITLEVGDYRKNRSEYLEKLAMQVKERALSEGHEQTIPQLKS